MFFCERCCQTKLTVSSGWSTWSFLIESKKKGALCVKKNTVRAELLRFLYTHHGQAKISDAGTSSKFPSWIFDVCNVTYEKPVKIFSQM